MPGRRSALLVLLTTTPLALALARAQDSARAEEPGAAAVLHAKTAFAEAHRIYVSWGKDEEVDSDLRREARDVAASTPADIVSFPERAPIGMALDAAAQDALAAADAWIKERLDATLARARAVAAGEAEVTTATATAPSPPVERQDVVLDPRAIGRTSPDAPASTCGRWRYDPASGLDALSELRGRTRAFDPERIAGVLGDLVKDDEGSFVEQLDGADLVHASPAGIARCRALVALLREAASARIGLDVRAYRMTRELWHELAARSPGIALSQEDERLVEKEAKEGKRAALLAAETTVAQDGQIVHVFQGESRACLSGFELDQAGLTPVVNPTFTKLNTGFVAELRPSLDAARTAVRLDAALVLSRPVSPCAKEKVQGVELELPELLLSRVSTTVVVPLGAAALLGGTFARSSGDDELDAPLASVVFVKPVLVASGGREPQATREGGGERAAGLDFPKALPGLAEGARGELARLGALAKALAAQLARVRAARVYRFELLDVRDLIDGRHDRAAPALGLPATVRRAGFRPLSVRNPIVARPGAGGLASSTSDTNEDDHGEGAVGEDKIELLVKAMTGGDEAWRDPASFGVGAGSVLVRQTPGMLARTAAAFATLRKGASRLVELEAGIYRVDVALLAELDAEGSKAGAAGGAIPASALARLDEAASKGERAAWLGGGFLVARSGERTYLHVGGERAYLAGFESTSGGTTSVVEKAVEPITGVVRTGLTLDVRATWDEDAWPRLTVLASVARARLRELGRDETSLGPATTPRLDMGSATASGALEEGAGLLVVASSADEKKPEKALAVLVRPRVLK